MAAEASDEAVAIALGCPLDRVLGFLAQAWMADVIYLLGGGALHFGALRRVLHGRVSARVLADRLRQLEALNLISREQRPTGRREVVYALTPEGAALDGVLRRLEVALETTPLPNALAARGSTGDSTSR